MEINNLLYRYGFLFTTLTDVKVPSHYKVLNVSKKHFFYYDDDRNMNVYENMDSFIILHGKYHYVGVDETLTRENLTKKLFSLYNENHSAFLGMLDFIGGRYVIIIGNQSNVFFYTDATSSRSVYYSTNENLVSSHANLIAENTNTIKNNSIEISNAMRYTYDYSPYENIKAIIPNFKLDYNGKNIQRFFPRAKNKYKNMDENSKLDLAGEIWKKNSNYYLSQYSNIVMSLTGGGDSRSTLAMLREHINKIQFFTYAATDKTNNISSRYDKTNDLDRVLVNQIVNDLKLNHQFIYYRHNKIKLNNEILEVLEKNTVYNHGKFLLGNYYDKFGHNNTLHIRSNLLEIGRGYLARTDFNDSSINKLTKSFMSYALKKKNKKSTEKVASLQNTIQKKNEEIYGDLNLFDYNLMDLSFWETRMGRWNSEIYNETDIVFDSCTLYNVRAIIDISLSFPLKKRKSNYFFKHLINKNYPVLNFYGVNTDQNLFENYNFNKNKLFTEFQIHKNNNLITNWKTEDNTLYIPSIYLKKSYSTSISFTFSENEGMALFTYLNKFNNRQAINYMLIEIFVNDVLMASEDISSWNKETSISLLNLKKQDIVTLKIRPLKNIKYSSWESASKIIITNFEMVKTKRKSPVDISTSNPYMEIIQQ